MRGVVLEAQRDGLVVVKAFTDVRPDLSAEEVGGWIRERLDAHGVPKAACLLAVPRDDVVIKRLHLPTPREDELPDMVNLAIRDELHFGEDVPIIDFLADQEPSATSNVLAAALPTSSLRRGCDRMLFAARPVAAMSLRLLGTRTLAADAHGARTVCIDASGDDLEITLMAGSDVAIARSASMPAEEAARTDAVVREVRRTWLSWQVEVDGVDVDRIVLLGPTDVTDAVATLMRELCDAPAHRQDEDARVIVAEGVVDPSWPLIGLMLACHTDKPLIDFVSPRKPPDVAARRRQHVLAGIGVLVVLFAAIWTIGNLGATSLRGRLGELEKQRARLEAAWLRHHRDRYRLAHLDLWEGVQPDWTDDFALVIERLRPAGSLVLDELSASLDYGGVEAARKASVDEWTVDGTTTLLLKVEAENREVGETFRQLWVQDEGWSVGTSGADTEDGRRLSFGLTIDLRSVADPGSASGETPE